MRHTSAHQRALHAKKPPILVERGANALTMRESELRVSYTLVARVTAWLAVLAVSLLWQSVCGHADYDLSKSSPSCLTRKGHAGICGVQPAMCAAPALVSALAPRWFGSLTALAGPVWAWVPLFAVLVAPAILVRWSPRGASLQEALFKAVCVPLTIAAITWLVFINVFRYTVVFTGGCKLP